MIVMKGNKEKIEDFKHSNTIISKNIYHLRNTMSPYVKEKQSDLNYGREV